MPLVMWLDSMKGLVPDPQNPGRIKTWGDQSGNKNDSSSECSNGCRALLVKGAINGFDAIELFPDSQLTASDSTTLHLANDWGFAMVVRMQTETFANSAHAFYFWSYDNVMKKGISLQNLGDKLLLADNDQTLFFNPLTTDHLDKWVIMVARGRQMEIRLNGVSAKGPYASGDQVSLREFDIVRNHVTLPTPHHQIAEVMLVNGTMTDSDVTNVEKYFKAKYAL